MGPIFIITLLVMGDRDPLLSILNTGDSLRDDVHTRNNNIHDAIERGKHALIPMLADW